ncbi:UDP-N-acetylmuramyl tripeptide synthase [Duganella sp. 1224]|uniref:hypothetical protein n=1 Tax=Duganella sp. 1224 TaxID=2587052 RepID=UPI0015CB5902|nr:hypothetical protein [Duganella sp. 1224]NYE59408.1 UDP-N-acetylmuramyl tripeptide synthase [Duganella sp. 1224]
MQEGGQVAKEVRRLAQHSAAATKEIKPLVGDSSAHLQQGGLLVAKAGDAMQRMVDSITGVVNKGANFRELAVNRAMAPAMGDVLTVLVAQLCLPGSTLALRAAQQPSASLYLNHL